MPLKFSFAIYSVGFSLLIPILLSQPCMALDSMRDVAEAELSVSELSSQNNYTLKGTLAEQKPRPVQDFKMLAQVFAGTLNITGTQTLRNLRQKDYSTLGNLPVLGADFGGSWKIHPKLRFRATGQLAISSTEHDVTPSSLATSEQARLNLISLGLMAAVEYKVADRWSLAPFIGARRLEYRQSSSVESAVFNATSLESFFGLETNYLLNPRTQIGIRVLTANSIDSGNLNSAGFVNSHLLLTRDL